MCKTTLDAPTYTLDHLKKRPDLIAVYDKIYDLVALAKEHPGGEMIRSAGAQDCTALFHSMHVGIDARDSKLLAKFEVGTYEAPKDEPVYVFDSDFAKDAAATVKREIKSRNYTSLYGPLGFWIRTFLICAGTLLFEYLWATTGLTKWGVLAGIFHAFIGLSVQHDASHGALSRNPTLNAIFSYGADWIGNSRWIWLQQHVLLHHCYTNHEGKDLDAHSAEPFLLFHPYEKASKKVESPRSWYHRFQAAYMYVVLSFYGPSVVFNMSYFINKMRHSPLYPKNPWMEEKLTFALVLRAFYIARIIVAPMVLANASMLKSLFLVNFVAGSILTFFFVLSHNFLESDRDPVVHSRIGTTEDGRPIVDWYKAQVETSCSYGGYVAMFFTGGLNFQIEHHLFPRISSWYYPMIRPALQKVCEKHNVKYTFYPTLRGNISSTVQYMNTVGRLKID